MPKDAYGNDVVDPFDLAIAQGVMRSTWASAITAVVVNLFAGCCIGAGQIPAIGITAGMIPVFLFGFLSIAAMGNVAIRVFTMQPEHKALVPSWHPWGALGLGVAGAAVAAGQVLVAAFFLYMNR
jgi:hypothetical protein